MLCRFLRRLGKNPNIICCDVASDNYGRQVHFTVLDLCLLLRLHAALGGYKLCLLNHPHTTCRTIKCLVKLPPVPAQPSACLRLLLICYGLYCQFGQFISSCVLIGSHTVFLLSAQPPTACSTATNCWPTDLQLGEAATAAKVEAAANGQPWAEGSDPVFGVFVLVRRALIDVTLVCLTLHLSSILLADVCGKIHSTHSTHFYPCLIPLCALLGPMTLKVPEHH